MIPTLVMVSMLSAAPAPDKSVRFFQGTYSEAIAQASSKKLPLFIDFYTDW